jgi:hypothetical protein
LKKPAHLRKALHVLGTDVSIQQAVAKCRDNYPSDGTFPYIDFIEGTECIVAKHETHDTREFLHLVTFERGAGAAVIETLRDIRIDEEPAPQDSEFIQSQVFLICSDGNVIFSTHNSPIHDTRIGTLLNNLINAFSEYDEPPSYVLKATLDEECYRQLMDQGIGEIDLNVVGYKQTLDYLLSNGQIQNAGFFSLLSSLVSEDISPEEKEAATKIAGRIILKPGHDWKDVHVKSLLTNMAKDLLDNDDLEDGFAIVTKNGLRITQDSVRIKETIRVEGNRRIVSVPQMFEGLNNACDQFEEMDVMD